MSRVPLPSTRLPVKTSLAPPTSRSRAPSPSKPATACSPRVRTKSVPKSPTKALRRPPPVEEEPPVPKAPLNIKEAIALKRAEARKAGSVSSSKAGFEHHPGFGSFEHPDDVDSPAPKKNEEETSELGRWSVKETIERARSTGSINLSSRSLPCLPSALFEIHLGIIPDALKSVPLEPPISSSTDTSTLPNLNKRSGQRDGPAWFEAQDLQILKAWNNDITEIQHEISLFGSLKTVDLHQNKITFLPGAFADLTALTNLDLSHNSLTVLPPNIFALPNLAVMNISHNAISELSFGAPFSKSSARNTQTNTSGSFFGPVITRASSPLPRLSVLNASHNRFTTVGIDYVNLPLLMTKANFSGNPLASGDTNSTPSFIQALGRLEHLKELHCETADIGDNAFALSTCHVRCFTQLRILDLGETRATLEGMQSALAGLKQDISFDFTTEEPPEGTLRVTVGKKVIREAWEVEAERWAKHRASKSTVTTESVGRPGKIDVDQDYAEVVKEAWELEAEHGILTEGGRRRARAAATRAAMSPAAPPKPDSSIGQGHPSTPVSTLRPSSSIASLTNAQYYHAPTQTLTLPPLSAPAKSHARSFSLATQSLSISSPQGKSDIALPTPTLPLVAIAAQSFAQTLKTLVLSNRKFDLSVSLPNIGESFLPSLEELSLDGCGLNDQIVVTRHANTSGSTTPPRSNDSLLPLLIRLFPSLRTLDLSYNALTSAALHRDILSPLILADDSHSRKGLRHLRLRGNRITELDGFQDIAEMFKGHRSVPDWKLEELDLRDNEICKLPAELGLLSLDVFLVDGNLFRIPQRRIWEREGTKGLLNWLRGRLE